MLLRGFSLGVVPFAALFAVAITATAQEDDADDGNAPGGLTGAAGAPEADADLRRLLQEEAQARRTALEAWDAAAAADAARDAAEAELERLTREALAARQSAHQAVSALSAVIAARQAAEADAVDPSDETDPPPRGTTADDSGPVAADTAEAARLAAEEEAARLAAEEEAARLAAEEAARIAEEEARRAAEAALERCVAVAGAPSAEVPVSEAAQRDAFEALAQARADCTTAARELPAAGAALYHLATIAQATGEHRQAVRLYERAAEAGEAAALTRLGDYYNFGIRPVREDIERAVEFYERAVAVGEPAAAATLGMMHRLGRGVPRDPERMIGLMRQAAEEGYHFAQYRLAQTFLSGEGVPGDALDDLGLPNPRAAVPLLAGAARAGNTEAAYELAALYADGAPGVSPNAFARYRWVDFLAERGEAPAIALRAFLIEQGLGTPRDPERAARDYVRALEAGAVEPETMRGTVNGAVPRWDRETALAFQRILQERGLYLGALDGQVGLMTLGAARELSR